MPDRIVLVDEAAVREMAALAVFGEAAAIVEAESDKWHDLQ